MGAALPARSPSYSTLATEAVRQAANGNWPELISGADIFNIIVFIEAAAMAGDEEALSSFDVYHEEAIEDETWTEFSEGHEARLATLALTDIDPEFGCADPEVAAYYATLTTKAPPLYIKNGQILDGNHRYEAARTRGETHILAYVLTAI